MNKLLTRVLWRRKGLEHMDSSECGNFPKLFIYHVNVQ